MKIKVKLDPGAKMPTKAHSADAGFDLYAKTDIEPVHVTRGAGATFDTGVHFEIPRGYVGFLMSKSGLNVIGGMTSTGVIDSGYTGSVVVKIYKHAKTHDNIGANNGFGEIIYPGQRISQIVFLPIPDVELEEVDEIEAGERGENGFGSSGR